MTGDTSRWDALWEKPERAPAQNVTPLDLARHSRYAAKALIAEVDNVRAAVDGTRNDTLNSAAFNLATLIGAGVLDEHETRDALRGAALSTGLDSNEIDKTIASAFKAGIAAPRDLPDTAREIRAERSTTADAPFGELDEQNEPPVEPPTDAELDEFWGSRPLLTHVHTFARARRASPWAVLGCVLARVVAATPPAVVLPPIVGGQGSLNLFVGLVGTSGSGKGAAERVAAEAVRIGKAIVTATTGSGEGIAHAYVKRERGGDIVQHTHEVLFTVPEIDTLSALGSRQGATLMPELRRGWSGESLGFAYADPTKRLLVEAHSYRMCLIAGIQPARARTLLDDADGGTPQRFVWVPATDRHAPDLPPDAPSPWNWRAPSSWAPLALRDPFSSGRTVMEVCDEARQVIDAARLARLRNQGDALDGHLLLAQLKIAAAFAIADSRLDVRDDDWLLADVITRVSTSVRAGVAQTLAASFTARNRMRAEGEAERAVIVEDKQAEASTRRAAKAILRALARDAQTSGALRRAVQHRDRGQMSEAIELLLATGQISGEELPNGTRYALA